MINNETVKKMVAMAKLPRQMISICALAKYIYGAKYPELCQMTIKEIDTITGWAEGLDGARHSLIQI